MPVTLTSLFEVETEFEVEVAVGGSTGMCGGWVSGVGGFSSERPSFSKVRHLTDQSLPLRMLPHSMAMRDVESCIFSVVSVVSVVVLLLLLLGEEESGLG